MVFTLWQLWLVRMFGWDVCCCLVMSVGVFYLFVSLSVITNIIITHLDGDLSPTLC